MVQRFQFQRAIAGDGLEHRLRATSLVTVTRSRHALPTLRKWRRSPLLRAGSRSEPEPPADSRQGLLRWRALEAETQTYKFRRLPSLLQTLTAEQRAQLQLQLAGEEEAHAVAVIVEGRLGAQPSCPRCVGGHVCETAIPTGCSATSDGPASGLSTR